MSGSRICREQLGVVKLRCDLTGTSLPPLDVTMKTLNVLPATFKANNEWQIDQTEYIDL